MRKKNRDKYYDPNNSMDDNNSSEGKEKEKKIKKNKGNKKSSKNEINDNILDEIKKEEDINEKAKILEEVNNTMIMENKNKREKPKKKYKKEKNESDEEDDDEVEVEEKRKKNFKEKEKQIEKEKHKEKEKQKNDKKKKKANNVLSDTINEINDELDEQYNLDIENIFEINKKFNFPKDSPVFYIREDDSKNDLYPSPLSTNKIKECLKTKEIKPFLVKVKLIDIFVLKDYGKFCYFDFNIILQKNWSKNLEYSQIFLNEYQKLYEKNKKTELEELNKTLEITKYSNEFIFSSKKKPKIKENKNKIIENEEKEKKNDITLNLNFSAIDKKGGYNDFSMSIIKQLQGVPLTKKQVDKITSIIEEVEEDEWTEIKNKKKELKKEPFIGIVGLNESKQIEPEENANTFQTNNKKNKKGKNKKKKFVNFNNQFAALKVDRGSDDEDE